MQQLVRLGCCGGTPPFTAVGSCALHVIVCQAEVAQPPSCSQRCACLHYIASGCAIGVLYSSAPYSASKIVCAGKDENREAYDAVISSGLTFIDTAEVRQELVQLWVDRAPCRLSPLERRQVAALWRLDFHAAGVVLG